jgi:hypothetical protein
VFFNVILRAKPVIPVDALYRVMSICAEDIAFVQSQEETRQSAKDLVGLFTEYLEAPAPQFVHSDFPELAKFLSANL